MQGSILLAVQYRGRNGVKETCFLSFFSPAKEHSAQEPCTHGLWECPWDVRVLGPLYPGRWEGALPSPAGHQHRSQLFPPPTLTSEARSDQLEEWDWVDERKTYSCGVLSFLRGICPKEYFYYYQEKLTQYSHSFLAANQWHSWGIQSLPAPVSLVWVNENYPSLFTACQQNKRGHRAFCSCPGWRENKTKQKKKLHLIDRSLGFWSRSRAWLPLRWHTNSGKVVKGHLLANCLFGLLRASSWKTEERRIHGIPADHKKSNCTL